MAQGNRLPVVKYFIFFCICSGFLIPCNTIVTSTQILSLAYVQSELKHGILKKMRKKPHLKF